MALVLTLKPAERIVIGDVVAYAELNDSDDNTIKFNVGGIVHTITDEKKTEVLPNVYVSAGKYNDKFLQYRLLFDAPRDVLILREESIT